MTLLRIRPASLWLPTLIAAALSAMTATAGDGRLAGRRLDPIEGEWSLTGGGDILIVADGDGYAIEVVDSPDRSVLPGTVIGRARATAVASTYSATVVVDPSDEGSRKNNFTLVLNDSEHLSFIGERKGLKVNPWRLLPYMFRGVVTPVDNRPDNLEGAVRKLPAGQSDRQPRRYL